MSTLGASQLLWGTQVVQTLAQGNKLCAHIPTIVLSFLQRPRSSSWIRTTWTSWRGLQMSEEQRFVLPNPSSSSKQEEKFQGKTSRFSCILLEPLSFVVLPKERLESTLSR